MLFPGWCTVSSQSRTQERIGSGSSGGCNTSVSPVTGYGCRLGAYNYSTPTSAWGAFAVDILAFSEPGIASESAEIGVQLTLQQLGYFTTPDSARKFFSERHQVRGGATGSVCRVEIQAVGVGEAGAVFVDVNGES
ncbi:hypothetical protein KC19_5G198100 [Ceratodon purpureus]|uniref:Uncharacterized protein n=1 Tax=Ceratodon purpureus TaxID=3225 RepID=A0A8T0I5P7_CERPU|nr:hypothetical protein KC19_5G198100 [Ceratodon purpureus]